MWRQRWHSTLSMSFGVEGEAEGFDGLVALAWHACVGDLPRRALDGLETPYLAMRRFVVQDLQARAYFNHQWLISLAHENLLDSCGKFCAQPAKTPAFLILTDDDFPRSNARKVLKS
jgi:hypothetical protein